MANEGPSSPQGLDFSKEKYQKYLEDIRERGQLLHNNKALRKWPHNQDDIDTPELVHLWYIADLQGHLDNLASAKRKKRSAQGKTWEFPTWCKFTETSDLVAYAAQLEKNKGVMEYDKPTQTPIMRRRIVERTATPPELKVARLSKELGDALVALDGFYGGIESQHDIIGMEPMGEGVLMLYDRRYSLERIEEEFNTKIQQEKVRGSSQVGDDSGAAKKQDEPRKVWRWEPQVTEPKTTDNGSDKKATDVRKAKDAAPDDSQPGVDKDNTTEESEIDRKLKEFWASQRRKYM